MEWQKQISRYLLENGSLSHRHYIYKCITQTIDSIIATKHTSIKTYTHFVSKLHTPHLD